MTALFTCLAAIAAETGAVAHAAAEVPRLSQMDVSAKMVVLTWIAFLLATVILYRIAWKPILRALDRREHLIRKSLEDAEKVRVESARTLERQQEILAAADAQAREIVESARRSAAALAQGIEGKAREGARAFVEEASREIEFQKNRALDTLRKETAELAASAADRILADRTGGPDDRAYTDRMIQELGPRES